MRNFQTFTFPKLIWGTPPASIAIAFSRYAALMTWVYLLLFFFTHAFQTLIVNEIYHSLRDVAMISISVTNTSSSPAHVTSEMAGNLLVAISIWLGMLQLMLFVFAAPIERRGASKLASCLWHPSCPCTLPTRLSHPQAVSAPPGRGLTAASTLCCMAKAAASTTPAPCAPHITHIYPVPPHRQVHSSGAVFRLFFLSCLHSFLLCVDDIIP